MAQYGLFVLKVWLNNNQPTNLWQTAGLLGHNPVTVLIGQHAVHVVNPFLCWWKVESE